MDALRHIEAMPVAEFNRLASLFDLSKKARKGAVRARTPETRTAEAIAKRLWLDGGGQGEPSERIVVIVALYAYSLHVMAESQLDLFRRVTAYLRRAFKDPTKKTRALTEAGLTAAEAEAALKAAPTRALAAASGRQFVELTRMIDGVGAVSFQVVHAATVAPSDDEFFAMVDREQRALA